MSLDVRAYEPLAPRTTLGVGGPARWFVSVRTPDALLEAHAWALAREVPLQPLGGGSNVVVADAGIGGLVVAVATAWWRPRQTADDLVVDLGAGDVWDDVVARLVADGWAGVECLSGIPGTVGGTPIQNVGAYGQEVADVVEAVHVLDRTTGALATLPASECGFAYRQSRFKGADAGRFLVYGLRVRLRRGAATTAYPDVQQWLSVHSRDATSLRDVRDAVLAIRRRKGMVVDPLDPDSRSVGSFFMNPVVGEAVLADITRRAGGPPPSRAAGPGQWRVPAAWFIARTALDPSGREGAVGLSRKHPLAIVNRGGATARDIVRFARLVKARVVDEWGVWLRPEPVFLGFDAADPDLEYLVRTEP